MTINEIKESVAETGRILLEKKLVARTWGNFSCRIDKSHFAITPSGLGYETLAAEDIPVFNMDDDTWEGRKPSSEKKIHAAAYRIFPEVNFVVHTHQNYGTAIGLVGTENLKMTDEEKSLLGRVAIASYGLPGTKKLKKAVEKALESGSTTILMVHHGAVILGTDRKNAIRKAEVLEEVCKRAFVEKVGVLEEKSYPIDQNFVENLQKTLKSKFLYQKINSSSLMIELASRGSFKTQLDDMSQMIGGSLKTVESDEKKILKALSKQDAVLVKGVGLVVKSDEDEDDVTALEILIEKAALARIYTHQCGKRIKLSLFDCALMHAVYKMKYSKQKNSKSAENHADKSSSSKNQDSEDAHQGHTSEQQGIEQAQQGIEQVQQGHENLDKKANSPNKREEFFRVLKFIGFSISAGVIELLSEIVLEKCLPWEKMTENPQIKYWVSYLIALILSVIWNFTLNRKFTFKSATNVPIAMLKVFAFYLVFTPATTYLQKFLCGFDWGSVDNLKGQFTTVINMVLNLTTEYLYDRFFVFRKSLDTNIKDTNIKQNK